MFLNCGYFNFLYFIKISFVLMEYLIDLIIFKLSHFTKLSVPLYLK